MLFRSVVCIVPRTLMGLTAGWTYRGLHRLCRRLPPAVNTLPIAATSLIAPVANTVLFLGAIWLFFRDTFVKILLPILTAVILTNAITEAIAGVIIGTAVSSAVLYATRRSR